MYNEYVVDVLEKYFVGWLIDYVFGEIPATYKSHFELLLERALEEDKEVIFKWLCSFWCKMDGERECWKLEFPNNNGVFCFWAFPLSVFFIFSTYRWKINDQDEHPCKTKALLAN